MTHSNSAEPTRRRAWRLFLALQVVLLAASGSWAGLRYLELSRASALPTLRNEPLTVLPRYDMPVVVSDEQLTRVLTRLAPKFQGAKTKINHVDHGLRFWSMAAEFADPERLSGDAMRHLLTDNRRFAEVFGAAAPTLLMDGPEGVRVRVQEGATSSSHVDHTMACLAEVGTPLDFPVCTPTRETTFRAMVEQAMRDFSLNQVEYEWSALTFALFMPPETSFVTRDGQRVDFDMLARRTMREALPHGVCFANHRLHALVMMLRIDEQTPILSPVVRAEVISYLQQVTDRLVATQHQEGYWDSRWPEEHTAGGSPERTSGDPVIDQILATGHPLEWWALAPPEVLPPRHVLASAGQWMVATIDGLSDEQIDEYFTFLSHAGRALALWRGCSASDVVRGEAVGGG